MNKNHVLTKNIQLLILDVDGVLTDGKIWFDADGNEFKAFNCQDGMGIKRLQELTDITVAVISGRYSESVAQRMKSLSIDHVFLGHSDKAPIFMKLKDSLQVQDEQICYVGDDLPDLPIMQQVGFPVAVNNAISKVKSCAKLITEKHGGNGAVREVCEHLIASRLA